MAVLGRSVIGSGLAALAAALVCLALGTGAADAGDAVSVEELDGLVATIEDEERRAAFVDRLKALIAVHRKSAEAPADDLGGRFLATLSQRLRDTSRQVLAAARALSDMPVLLSWARFQVGQAEARDAWLRLLAKLAATLAAGLVAERLARLVLARPRRAIEGREADSLLVRAPFVVLRGFLDTVPVAAFAAAAYAVLPLLQPAPRVHVLAIGVIYAYAVARGCLIVARLVLVPAVPSLRVLPMEGETANYLYIWVRRLVAVVVVGYLSAEAALMLGLPPAGHGGLLRLVGLLVGAMVVLIILQNRRPVAAWLRGDGGGRALGGLRQRLADVWHVLAMLYVIGVYGVWALDVAGGFEFLLRATVVTVIAVGVARLIVASLRRGVERGFAVKADLKARFPRLEERANRYLPVLHLVVRAVVTVIAVLVVLKAWGVDAFAWLDSPFGRRIGQAAFSIAAVLVLALLAWEAVSAAVERYLAPTDAAGRPVERSARVRTLLPLLRNVVFVVLAVMVALIVLSELGINIGPLLAGAGVVGLAVGFGAQTLVKDVITGLFILVEDTIAVGDYVEVAGHAGTVEAISIRTLRLRDPAGSVHTVPFSDVGTVLNYTRDYAYAVLDIGVGYGEDVDEVMAVIADIGAEMAAEPELAADIIEPLEVQGLNSLDDSAVVIRARIKTRPGMQWSMRRAFNRRMKRRFDELDIEIPFPHTTVYFGEGADGSAPPLRTFAESADAGPARAAHTRARKEAAAKRRPSLAGEPSGDDVAGD